MSLINVRICTYNENKVITFFTLEVFDVQIYFIWQKALNNLDQSAKI